MFQPIHYELLFHYIHFKDMMKLRQINRLARDTYNKPCFWFVVNITDFETQSYFDLVRNVDLNSNRNEIYNLSGKGPIFNYPVSLGRQLIYCKLLIL